MGSGSAAAFTLSQCSAKDVNAITAALPNRSSVAEGSTSAASLTMAACSGESSPFRTAAPTMGCPATRRAVSMAALALPVLVPD